MNLGLFSRNSKNNQKNTDIAKGGHFFCAFLSALSTWVKETSIINSHHLFLVSSHVFNSLVTFDANFLRSFPFILSKILRKLSLLFLRRNVAMWANVRSQLCQIWLVHWHVFLLSFQACYRIWAKVEKLACWLFQIRVLGSFTETIKIYVTYIYIYI